MGGVQAACTEWAQMNAELRSKLGTAEAHAAMCQDKVDEYDATRTPRTQANYARTHHFIMQHRLCEQLKVAETNETSAVLSAAKTEEVCKELARKRSELEDVQVCLCPSIYRPGL